ncbi:MAG: GFA family protein [Pseudomonadota bacterium]|nr:GFA family protein [Pseudomonadota bacterium]
MSEKIAGGCLCGAVRFEIEGPFDHFYMCHCSRCQKVTGSAHASNLFLPVERITWLSGQERIKRFDLPEAKRFARAFCTECGSPVPFESRAVGILVVPAGCLEGDPGIRPEGNIFWPDRTPWYDDGLQATRFDSYPK